MPKKKVTILLTCIGRRVSLLRAFRSAFSRLGLAGRYRRRLRRAATRYQKTHNQDHDCHSESLDFHRYLLLPVRIRRRNTRQVRWKPHAHRSSFAAAIRASSPPKILVAPPLRLCDTDRSATHRSAVPSPNVQSSASQAGTGSGDPSRAR